MVSLVFPPDTSAASMLFGDLLPRLAPAMRVTVLCGFPTKDADLDVSRLPRRSRLGDVEIVRCGPRVSGKRTLLLRALAYAGFLLDAGRQVMRFGADATVVGTTDPPFTPAAVGVLARLARWRHEEMVLDLYPDGLVAAGTVGMGAPLTRAWQRLNRHSFRNASRVIVIGRDMAHRIEHGYGVAASQIAYVPLWAPSDVDLLAAGSGNPTFSADSSNGPLTVQYSGNMGLWHDLDTIVRAANLLRDDDTIRFQLIGKGMRRAGAERLAADLGLPNVTWADFVPREHLAESLGACDAALISLRAGLSGVAVPSKLYGILASGRAVIAQVPHDSEVALVVREEACGVVIEPGNAYALADAIRALAADREGTRRMGECAREAYRARYTLDAAVRRFLALWAPEHTEEGT